MELLSLRLQEWLTRFVVNLDNLALGLDELRTSVEQL